MRALAQGSGTGASTKVRGREARVSPGASAVLAISAAPGALAAPADPAASTAPAELYSKTWAIPSLPCRVSKILQGIQGLKGSSSAR